MDFYEAIRNEVVVSSKIVSFEIVKGDDEYMNGTVVVKNPILLDDRTARFVFSNNKVALLDFLKSLFEYLGYDLNIHEITAMDSQKLSPASKKHGKDEYLDLLCLLDDIMYCNVEFYTRFANEELCKSLSYSTRSYGNQLYRGSKYKTSKPMISINLVIHNQIDGNSDLVNEYCLIKKGNVDVILTENIKFIVINLDKLPKKVYTKCRLIKWLLLIASTKLEELEERAKGDKIMETVVQDIRKYFTPGGIDRAIPEDKWHQAMAEERGMEKRSNEIALDMLHSGYSVQETSRISKIPIDELSKWNI